MLHEAGRKSEKNAFLEKKNVNKDWRESEDFLAKYQLTKTSVFQKDTFYWPPS